MIRIRVFKAYELAVGLAAVLLIAAIVALCVTAFSQGEAIETFAPASGTELPDAVSRSAAVPAFSGAEAPIFAQIQTLRAVGENVAPHVSGENVLFWNNAPKVLIYHTHTYEAYTMAQDDLYVETEQWRTADERYNVLRVGEALCEELRLRGIDAVQDRTNHELPVLGTAYARSLETVSGRIESGETYDLCIDVHRDAYVEGSGPNTVDTPGGKAAKFLFLIGRGDNFLEKPDLTANTALAQELSGMMNERVPGLCKQEIVRENRYNQHLGERALLLEAGNNLNTIDEVLRAVPYFAEAIAQSLHDAPAGEISGEYIQLSNIK